MHSALEKRRMHNIVNEFSVETLKLFTSRAKKHTWDCGGEVWVEGALSSQSAAVAPTSQTLLAALLLWPTKTNSCQQQYFKNSTTVPQHQKQYHILVRPTEIIFTNKVCYNKKWRVTTNLEIKIIVWSVYSSPFIFSFSLFSAA